MSTEHVRYPESTFMIGKTILHYKILSKLGEGGMGVVYKAKDTELEREVAIKFLPHHIASDTDERERFRIEAKAAAALNHPNIATIYAIEHGDDESFIAMEYIEGQELKAKIDSGPLALDEFLKIGLQIAKGLQAAHQKEVVHRDIKSANIMLTQAGAVKIMDFGLAKRGDQAKLTKEGTTLGTVAYMSPEQTRGDEVDHRSDIFSLGVLLYQMLTGQLPFKGDYDQAVTYSILNEEPEPLTGLRTGLPVELERMVNKCLAKDPSQRYQHMEDLIVDLSALQEADASGTGSVQTAAVSAPQSTSNLLLRKALPLVLIAAALLLVGYFILAQLPAPNQLPGTMIAVLPFEHLGPAEDEYFTDGMTEEITNRLTSVAGIGVISRTSAMQYKKTDKTLKEIGSELGVTHVLEGTVRWARGSEGTNRLKVSPRLVRVTDDRQLWSKSYDRLIDDVFEVQSDIAVQVISGLEVTLLEPERRNLEARPTDNIQAYEYFLHGRDIAVTYEKERLEQAVEMYKQAIALDPNFAVAYASLARAHASLYHFYDRSEEREAQTRIAALKALELAPDSYESHLAQGFYHYHVHKNFEAGLNEFEIAARMRPNDPQVLEAVGLIQRRQGKWAEHVASFRKALQLNPVDAGLMFDLGDTYATLRQYDLAFDYIERCLALRPDFHFALIYKAQAHWMKDWDLKAARESLRPIWGSEDTFIAWACYLQEMAEGNYESAIRLISRSREDVLAIGYSSKPRSLFIGYAHLLAGNSELGRKELEKTLDFLQKAVLEPEGGDLYLGALGIANALLGNMKAAIEAGEQAVAAYPVSWDAAWGPYLVEDLAWIYALAGQPEQALTNLDRLLSIPAEFSITMVEFDEKWAPLRDHPGYAELVQKHGQ